MRLSAPQKSTLFAQARASRAVVGPGRWALFGCGDSDYVPKLIVSLASVKRFHPQLDAFIFCPRIHAEDIPAAAQVGIQLVPIDPSTDFQRVLPAGGSTWPRESFGHLLAWRILSCFGYDYSISIDGDVLCCRPLDLQSVAIQGADLACVCNGTVGRQFRMADLSTPEELLFFSRLSHPWRWTPNTGIIFWNHSRLKRSLFARRVLDVFRNLPSGYHIPSDQHLLAITIAEYSLRIHWLDTRWNFCRGVETVRSPAWLWDLRFHPDRCESDPQKVFFLHLFKPWERLQEPAPISFEPSAAAENCFRAAMRDWLTVATNIYADEMPRRLLGGRTPPADAGGLSPVELPRMLGLRRWFLSTLGLALGIPGLFKREAAVIWSFIIRRPPLDFSCGILQRGVPPLRPSRLLGRVRGAQPIG